MISIQRLGMSLVFSPASGFSDIDLENLANVSVHLTDGPMTGLKLDGFTVVRQTLRSGARVKRLLMPNNVWSILDDNTAQDAFCDLVVEAYTQAVQLGAADPTAAHSDIQDPIRPDYTPSPFAN